MHPNIGNNPTQRCPGDALSWRVCKFIANARPQIVNKSIFNSRACHSALFAASSFVFLAFAPVTYPYAVVPICSPCLHSISRLWVLKSTLLANWEPTVCADCTFTFAVMWEFAVWLTDLTLRAYLPRTSVAVGESQHYKPTE